MANPFLKINDKYYVRHEAAVVAGCNSETFYGRSKRNPEKWDIIKDPNNGNANLYGWDELKPADRSMIENYYHSSPAEYMAIQPIRDMIVRDDKAEAFFLDYKYDLNGKKQSLKQEWIESYTRNASLLNMLKKATEDKVMIKKQFGMKLMPWFDKVGELIKQDGYSLPSAYRGLISRSDSVLKRYISNGYATLVDGRIGQMNSAKVVDLGKDMMLELLSHPNQYDDAYICEAYNQWCRFNGGYKPVTQATVGNFRREYGFEVKAFREGWQEYNKEFSRSIQRAAPSQPLYLVEGDDNHIDWWFADDKKKGVIHRLKAYVVVDSFMGIEYPLGWAFSENDITIETIRLAFLMAMHHIHELTGGWYLPHEVKTDRWQLSSLKTFYESLGNYYPTPVGSKNRGWLENFFGHSDWKRSLKMNPDGLPSNNYTGHNIISKNVGVNLEALNQVHRTDGLPRLSEAGKWMEAHFNRLRTMPIGFKKGEKSRQELWLEGWNQLADDKKRVITGEQMLLKCGMEHAWQNEITKSGVQPTIAGHTYTYSVPAAYYLQNVGRKVYTYFDPFDMSNVLVTDKEGVRFVAQHITPVAGCMADMQEGGRTFLNQIISEKKEDVDTITKARDARRERLYQNGMDPEMVLKQGPAALKELKQAAVEEWTMPEEVQRVKALPLPVESEPNYDNQLHNM